MVTFNKRSSFLVIPSIVLGILLGSIILLLFEFHQENNLKILFANIKQNYISLYDKITHYNFRNNTTLFISFALLLFITFFFLITHYNRQHSLINEIINDHQTNKNEPLKNLNKTLPHINQNLKNKSKTLSLNKRKVSPLHMAFLSMGILIALFSLSLFFTSEEILQEANKYKNIIYKTLNLKSYSNRILTLSHFIQENLNAIQFISTLIISTIIIIILFKKSRKTDETLNNTYQSIYLLEKGLQYDRLKKSLEHLGHHSSTVRLGGIYEFYYLAQDIVENRKIVLNILSRHIKNITSAPDYRDKYRYRPSHEIQTTIDILFKSKLPDGNNLFLYPINLSSTYLVGIDFTNAYMPYVNLSGSIIHKANFKSCYMPYANLNNVKAKKSLFTSANLSYASIDNSSLAYSDFDHAIMIKSHITNSHLQHSYFIHSQLQGSNLTNSHFQASNLWNSQLQGTIINNTGFQDAVFSLTDLRGVQNHSFSKLDELINQESNLNGATFQGGLTYKLVSFFPIPEEAKAQLQSHIDLPINSQPPSPSISHYKRDYNQEQEQLWIKNRIKIITGSFTAKEIEIWDNLAQEQPYIAPEDEPTESVLSELANIP